MKIWMFVEGESDRIALNTLWAKWRVSLQSVGWGIQIIVLDNKSKFFRKIGHRAAEKLRNCEDDLVVGLPDLYPNHPYTNSEYSHADFAELKIVQTRLVEKALTDVFHMPQMEREEALKRFLPTAFKHDMEMLLLAAREELCVVLGTCENLGNWRHPVEEQNHTKPPKYVVDELFHAKRGTRYRDTIHAKAVLEKVVDIRTILYRNERQLQCPRFKELMDWIGTKTGVRAY